MGNAELCHVKAAKKPIPQCMSFSTGRASTDRTSDNRVPILTILTILATGVNRHTATGENAHITQNNFGHTRQDKILQEGIRISKQLSRTMVPRLKES